MKYFSLSKPLLVACFHFLLLFLVYRLLLLCGYITPIDIFFLKQWDAYWYASIAEHGYLFDAEKPSNSGFFPLFPYIWKLLWKLTDAGIRGVCMFNTTVFVLGLLVLKRTFHFSWPYFLLFLSLPSNLFMYVPYTEAVFFFFSALILSGIKTKNEWMLVAGLFFASLTKPAAPFFIISVISMEILFFTDGKRFVKRVFALSAAPVLSVLMVTLIQYKATGVWFTYFKAQSQFWQRTLQLPKLPFTTWGGPRTYWLDGLALFFGLLAAAVLISFFLKSFRKDNKQQADEATVFSVTFLTMTLLSVLFFNGKDNVGGTSLMGANRYLMATPFFLILLCLISDASISKKYNWIIYGGLAILVICLLKVDGGDFYSYSASDGIFYRVFILACIMMYALTPKQWNNRFIYAVYALNIFIQIIYLNKFAYSEWIG